DEWNLLVSTDQQAVAQFEIGVRIDGEPWQMRQQGCQSLLRFEPRERGTQAEVDTLAAAQGWRGSGDVESVGVHEAARVAVGRTDEDGDNAVLGNRCPADVDIL